MMTFDRIHTKRIACVGGCGHSELVALSIESLVCASCRERTRKEANMAAWAEGELHHDPHADVSEAAYDAWFAVPSCEVCEDFDTCPLGDACPVADLAKTLGLA